MTNIARGISPHPDSVLQGGTRSILAELVEQSILSEPEPYDPHDGALLTTPRVMMEIEDEVVESGILNRCKLGDQRVSLSEPSGIEAHGEQRDPQFS